MNADDLQYLERHLADAGRVELRALYPSGQVMSGQFDKAPALVDAIHNLRQETNLYYTAQAPALRAVPNRMGTGALGNDDIASFTPDCVRSRHRARQRPGGNGIDVWVRTEIGG